MTTRGFKLHEVVLKNLKSSNDLILAFSDMFEILLINTKLKKIILSFFNDKTE